MSSAATTERRGPRSLAIRLTVWYAGAAFLLILLATGALYAALAAHLDEEQDELLADKVRILTVLVRDRGEDDRLLRDFRRALVAVLLIAPAASALVGYRVARRGLRPIAEVSAAAARITAATLGGRMDAAHLPAELAELAATFNAMLDR